MLVHVEVELKSSSGIDWILSKLEEFTDVNTSWTFDPARSKRLADGTSDEKAIVLTKCHEFVQIALLIFGSSSKCLKVHNIVPQCSDGLSVETYNQIAASFVNDFKAFSKGENIRVIISNPNPSIKDIISSNVPRQAFEDYLNQHPLSFHPLDIARLDSFICAFARYSKKPMNSDLLGAYLQEQHSWTPEHVSWLVNRIEIGLEIIKAYRNYY
ncbi:hypothetical protein [Marinomonas mediterranea]|uniref:hypothetical protein n=1 Tax=Marinomonas mediterranea TaxID=119864 RepID=UPI002349E1A9|nr:hypothetical protein [Marinomonas mediterranea]WCN10875.1 hypothetical protein GV055_19040 [Marinomonas mediterranea]